MARTGEAHPGRAYRATGLLARPWNVFVNNDYVVQFSEKQIYSLYE